MARKINVGEYKRKGKKGKVFIVKPHKRTVRKVGKKITYKPIGTFLVGHDEYGNFAGSKVIKRKRLSQDKLNKIDTDFYIGKLTLSQWRKKRQA